MQLPLSSPYRLCRVNGVSCFACKKLETWCAHLLALCRSKSDAFDLFLFRDITIRSLHPFAAQTFFRKTHSRGNCFVRMLRTYHMQGCGFLQLNQKAL
jgi:hypothetical protein